MYTGNREKEGRLQKAKKEETLEAIQLGAALEKLIRQRWKPGELLPPEKEMLALLPADRKLWRMALGILEATGVVRRITGKGVVVLQKPTSYPIHDHTRYTEILEKNGRIAETRVLRKLGIPATGEIAERLRIAEGEPVIFIHTLGMMDGAPLVIGSQYFLLEKLYDLLRKYQGGSLHQFVAERYGIGLKRIFSLVAARSADEQDAALLEIQPGSALLQVKSVNVEESSGQPLEYVDSRFKGDAIELIIDLEKG